MIVFWRSHIVLSIICEDKTMGTFYPLFCELCEEFGATNAKLLLFFLNCLFFHSFKMLQEPKNKKNNFLKRYFNWGRSVDTFGYGPYYFYHLDLSYIVPSSPQSSVVDLILKKEYLKVLKFSRYEVRSIHF